MYYINYFFIMSIIGHFIESFFNSGNSGILFGYWTPIYGIGCIIILVINKYVNKLSMERFWKIITLFISCMIVLSITEVIGAYLIKWIFNKELWNYTSHKSNIGRYTSLEMGLLWGVSSLFFICFIKPVVDKFINKIPKIISYVCITLFFIDILATSFIKV